MSGVLRWTLAAAAAVAALALVPAGASAQGSCIFDDLEASERNRDEVERSLFCLTNVHRVRSGLATVKIDTRLAAAARSHSDYMIASGYFGHFPGGSGPSARAAAFGYPFGAGENIATNLEGTAAKLFDQWLNSAGHNQNMLGANYLAAGMGITPRCCPGFGGPGVTGTQLFGVGPADSDDDALDFYASSNRCASAKESLFRKRAARRRAKGEKRRRLRERIRDLKKDVDKRCKELPGT